MEISYKPILVSVCGTLYFVDTGGSVSALSCCVSVNVVGWYCVHILCGHIDYVAACIYTVYVANVLCGMSRWEESVE